MAMKKNVNGVDVELTAAEETALLAEWVEAEIEQLAQARAAAIEETIADTERKRLDAVRDAVAAEFKDAKSAKDVADKLAELKAGKATR